MVSVEITEEFSIIGDEGGQGGVGCFKVHHVSVRGGIGPMGLGAEGPLDVGDPTRGNEDVIQVVIMNDKIVKKGLTFIRIPTLLHLVFLPVTLDNKKLKSLPSGKAVVVGFAGLVGKRKVTQQSYGRIWLGGLST